MNETMLVALVFVVLLGLEWRHGLRSLRLVAALLALVVWLFAQPAPTRATRRAIAMPAAERVTQNSRGDPLSEYATGVLTMERAVAEDAKTGANARLLGVGVLLWLAGSPALRRARGLSIDNAPARQPRED